MTGRAGTIYLNDGSDTKAQGAITSALAPALNSWIIAKGIPQEICATLERHGFAFVPKEPTQAMLDETWTDAHEEDARGVWLSIIQAWDHNHGKSDVGNG